MITKAINTWEEFMKLKNFTLLLFLILISFVYGKTDQTEESRQDTVKFKESIDLRVKSGIFLPADNLVSDVYGEGITYGVDVTVCLRGGLGLGLSIQQYKAFAELPTEEILESNISIVPVMISMQIEDNKLKSDFKPYFGIGIGLVFVDEKYKAMRNSYTVSDTNIGFASTFGMRAEHVFLEFKVIQARIRMSSVLGSDYDFNGGGVSICAGISF
jgi:outer membrane protein W